MLSANTGAATTAPAASSKADKRFMAVSCRGAFQGALSCETATFGRVLGSNGPNFDRRRTTSMAMHKKANGGNYTAGTGALTVTFDSGGPALVYVVCIWGPKPQFGGQRPKVWCTETVTSGDGTASVTVPEGMAIAGAQVTWSGGLIAPG